jgi:ribosomal protein S1
MEIITEIKQKTKIIDTPTTITPTPEDEIRVPDLSYFEEETIIDYGPDDPFKLAMDNIQVPEPGSVYDTTFVGSDETHFLLDGNFKDLVRVPKTSEESNFFVTTEVGDEVRVIIAKITDDKQYSIDGSVSFIHREEAFQMIGEMPDDRYLMVKINKLTGAGYNCTLTVNGCEIQSFLPQILAGVNKIHDDEKEELVGKELEMCVESYASDKGTWIVSRRKYLKQLIPAYMDNLDKDTDYEGTVTGTAKFGVFVEFNDCLTGMIHRSNLTDELKETFNDIKAGDLITFNVKEIIKGNRIILTQVHTESLWDSISVGQKLTGTIKEHKPFGSLIILDHETLGLIHSSEQTPEVKELKSGEKLDVKVLAINKSERKIYLRNN